MLLPLERYGYNLDTCSKGKGAKPERVGEEDADVTLPREQGKSSASSLLHRSPRVLPVMPHPGSIRRRAPGAVFAHKRQEAGACFAHPFQFPLCCITQQARLHNGSAGLPSAVPAGDSQGMTSQHDTSHQKYTTQNQVVFPISRTSALN